MPAKKPKSNVVWSKIESAKQRAKKIFDSSQDESSQSQHQEVDSEFMLEEKQQQKKDDSSQDELKMLTQQCQKDKTTITALEEELRTLKKQHSTMKDQSSRVSSAEVHKGTYYNFVITVYIVCIWSKPSSSQTRHVYSFNDEHFKMSSTYQCNPYAGSSMQPHGTGTFCGDNNLYDDYYDTSFQSSVEYSDLDYDYDNYYNSGCETGKQYQKNVLVKTVSNGAAGQDYDSQTGKHYQNNAIMKAPSKDVTL
ncbi:uncharacterized protein [Dysidea avara]|uniref:uncharacterized protein n=1 Tax=Dysidea avara TaxID=196820 RepID=UPI0033257A54